MTDRELLELAAKAIGMRWQNWTPTIYIGETELREWPYDWNPLEDDGDALRLAVTLGIALKPYPIYSMPKHSVIAKQNRQTDSIRVPNPTEVIELYGNDPYAATRRAIVRAAVAIGKEMSHG